MRKMYLLLARDNSPLFTSVVLVMLFVSFVFADVPHLISYQGRLTDAGGAPITGSRNITFKLYDVASGGIALWSETQTVTLNSEGLYNVMLGSATPFPVSVDFSEQYWLAVEYPSGTEICRYQLGASPYALNIADTVFQTGGYFFTNGTYKTFLTQTGLTLPSGEIFDRSAAAVYGFGNDDIGVYGRSNYWEGIIGYSEGDDGIQGVSSHSSYAGMHGINSSISAPAEGFIAYNGYGLYSEDNAYIGDYLQFANLSSAPSASEGRIYYNSSDQTLYLYDGAVWQDLLAGGGGGVTGIRANAESYLTGDITLQEGTNITPVSYTHLTLPTN